MHIFLTGFMASGKSTIGPLVADRLNRPFADLDDLIEAEAEQTIPSIFAAEGEAGFRQREANALRATASRADAVIALGGGTVVDPDNRAWTHDHGCVVYLQVSPETVLDRVADAAAERPLLHDDAGDPLSRPAMAQRIREMLRERAAAYEAADCVIDAEALPPVVADRVVAAVPVR